MRQVCRSDRTLSDPWEDCLSRRLVVRVDGAAAVRGVDHKVGEGCPLGQQPGGATQLQVFKGDGSVATVEDLLEKGILKGKESPVGFS